MADTYTDIRKDLENFYCLNKYLGEIKYIFTNVPQSFTQDSISKNHVSYTDKYSPYYVGKKKVIKTQADKIQETFIETNRYSGTGSTVDTNIVLRVLREISVSFGDQEGENVLPAQYVDAYKTRGDIAAQIIAYMTSVTTIIKMIKDTMDVLRGPTGIGDQEIQSLYTDAIERAKSPVSERNIEQLALSDITEINKIASNAVQATADGFRAVIQKGGAALDSYLKAGADKVVKMALMGFPGLKNLDRNTTLQDHVREKVRKKFGAIPFEDEEETTDITGAKIFVKKSELVEITDKSGNKIFVKKSVMEARKILNNPNVL